ncbi:MAG: tRNA pseudouridine(38-40) synthase TruA [Candidatus Margulisiibacteriota bacterium]|nr:MAG: tRNA pseudouridine(38-40) synthase TruA [Candidatus Margulisbacteria bacterium GWD2_39_127]OGI04618.1 MAG: tRNA pseudouridine(38-40) synthase TruA [Candidatus Margulisbacteria bacterium GWF2_38_17]OGI11850.1 MAG: tRNA pseudouridine(38-40) synthase TruA [Candidatus Margulisbacteria bacterium GWE2_39_32]PZM79775.1 MAG: tRNA pseudouridine(38-40) synthase TruA [Candidatus Margulisiibacteriota bacterium]HAR62680.1 tRNA pseudouridine(38-40) synthase TruA [Candidatus Margulisiibacteriota bacte
MNVKLIVSYDGTSYRGFQRQTRWSNTIQNVLEECITKIFEKKINVCGSGRTDAGVHAIGQVVNFSIDTKIPVIKIPELMNKRLPFDIRIVDAQQVRSAFNARIDAKRREYRYLFYKGNCEFPGIDRFCWKLDNLFDLKIAAELCSNLMGTKDFNAFMSSGSSAATTVKTIYNCSIQKVNEFNWIFSKGNFQLYELTVEANAFLYNMVRIIVANIVRVATGQEDKHNFLEILESKNRKLAGKMAPANGLYLTKVTY